MLIGKGEYKSIVITDSKNSVVAVITDKDIIEHEGYKVMLEPTKE